MKKIITALLVALVCVSLAPIANAQTYSYAPDGTPTSTLYYYSTVSTSTSSGGVSTSTNSLQNQIVLLQTQAVLLFGQLISQLNVPSTADANIVQAVRSLKLAWVGLAQSQITILRARFGL